MQLKRKQLDTVLTSIIEQSAPHSSVHHMCGYGVWVGKETLELTNDFILDMAGVFGGASKIQEPEQMRMAIEHTSNHWDIVYGLDDLYDMWETFEDEFMEDKMLDVNTIYVILYHLTDESKDERYFSVTRLSDAIQGLMASKHQTCVKRYRILDVGGVQKLNTAK